MGCIPHIEGYYPIFNPSIIGKAGGVIIYHEHNIKLKVLDSSHLIAEDSNTEVIIVTVTNFDYVFALIYRHPTSNIDKIFSYYG